MKLTVCKSNKVVCVGLALMAFFTLIGQVAHASELQPVNDGCTYSIPLPGGPGNFQYNEVVPLTVRYDGKSVYRFKVDLPAPIEKIKDGWYCCTNHWAYKIESNLRPENANGGEVGTTTPDSAPSPGDSYLCSIRWTAPPKIVNVSIKANGKMRPWGEGGGFGQEYTWDCEWKREINAQVNIQVSGTTEDNEDNPGAIIPLNGVRNVTLQLDGQMREAGKIHVTISSSDIEMKLDKDDAQSLGQDFYLDLAEGGTINCKIEGKAITEQSRTITVTFMPGNGPQTNGEPDTAKITVFGVEIAKSATYKYIRRTGGSFRYCCGSRYVAG